MLWGRACLMGRRMQPSLGWVLAWGWGMCLSRGGPKQAADPLEPVLERTPQ